MIRKLFLLICMLGIASATSPFYDYFNDTTANTTPYGMNASAWTAYAGTGTINQTAGNLNLSCGAACTWTAATFNSPAPYFTMPICQNTSTFDFIVYADITNIYSTNSMYAGIYLAGNNTGTINKNVYWLGRYRVDPTNNYEVSKIVNGVQTDHVATYANQYNTSYFRVRFNATDYVFSVSQNQTDWVQVYTVPVANVGFGPKYLGLFLRQDAGGTSKVAFDNASISMVYDSNWYYFRAFDELATSNQLLFNATVTNGLNSKSYSNVSTIYDCAQATNVSGIDTITIQDAIGSYVARTYSGTTGNNSAINISAYLLANSLGQLVRFSVRAYNDNPIAGATVSAYKLIGGTYAPVAIVQADSSGTSSIYLSQTQTYTIAASAPGYSSTNVSLVPSSTDYRIYLTSNATSGVTLPFTNVSISFNPTSRVLNISNQEYVALVYSDSDSLTRYFGLEVYWNNTQVFFANWTNQTGGGTINATLNTTKYQGAYYITVVGFFKKDGFSEINYSQTYSIGNPNYDATSLWSLSQRLAQSSNTNLQPIVGVIFLLIIAVVSSTVAGATSFVGGGAFAVVMIFIATGFGSFGTPFNGSNPTSVWVFPIFISLVVVSIMYLRGRI